jgi:double-strand break repair protein MRE11
MDQLLEPPDEDTLRVMIATDNHVGFLERDPVRGLDSFAALEGRVEASSLYTPS